MTDASLTLNRVIEELWNLFLQAMLDDILRSGFTPMPENPLPVKDESR